MSKDQSHDPVKAWTYYCIQLGEMLDRTGTDFPEKTAKKTAENIRKSMEIVEENLGNLEITGNVLTDIISGMNPEDTEKKELTEMLEMATQDIDAYTDKYDSLKKKHTKTLEEADKLTTPEKPQATNLSRELITNNGLERFIEYSDLKPTYLNQDSSMIEINQWCNQLKNYLNMGYRGNPPTSGIWIHTLPGSRH